jgi:hypothetical protein
MSSPIIVGHKPTTHAANGAPHVYQAICGVTAALAKEGVSKDRKNQQQGYAFRGIEDVQNALAPLLASHQLCMLPSVIERTCVERQTQKGGTLFYVTLRVRFDLVSAQDGSSHSIVTEGEAMDSADKATNKAMSAAAKYACILSFCIPTEGTEDADYHTPESVAPRQPVNAPLNAAHTMNSPAARELAAKLERREKAPEDSERLRDRVGRVISTVAMLDSTERINKAFSLSQELREELFLQGCEEMLKKLEEAFKAARARVSAGAEDAPY